MNDIGMYMKDDIITLTLAHWCRHGTDNAGCECSDCEMLMNIDYFLMGNDSLMNVKT